MLDKRFIGSFDLSLIPSMEEFDPRYRGTFMKLTFPDKETSEIFLYSGYEGDEVYFKNDTQGSIVLKRESTTQVEAFFPTPGLFNTREFVPLILYKIPARMNKRSVCDKNAKITNPIQRVFGGLTNRLRSPTISAQSLRDSLSGNFVSISTADLLIKEGKTAAVAISRDYMISEGSQPGVRCLWFRDLPIGIFGQQKGFYVDEHYYQEFRDFLVRSENSTNVFPIQN